MHIHTKTLLINLSFIASLLPATGFAQTYSGDKSEEVTAAKCRLAKNILKGTAVHTDGTPTDQYDLDTAKSDVQIFCKKS